MKHIFLIFHNFGLGGVQRRMVDLANYIANDNEYQDVTCHIILREKTKFTFEKYLLFNPRIQVHYAPSLPKIPFLWRLKNVVYGFYLWLMILRYQPLSVMIFLQFSLPFVIISKILLPWIRFKIVLSQDNILSYYNRPQHVTKVFPLWSIRLIYWFCQTIIVQTYFAKADLVKNFKIDERKIKVIQNWAVNKIGKESQKKYDFIYCGRFVAQKNIHKMIEFISKINKTKNANLLLVGDGPEKKRLILLAKKLNILDKVIFMDSTYQVQQLLAQSKIFILTSSFEGHPMILLEAMRLGVVPLLLNYPGVKEYIKNGSTGLIATNQVELVKLGLELLKDSAQYKKLSVTAKNEVKLNNGDQLIKETLKLLV